MSFAGVNDAFVPQPLESGLESLDESVEVDVDESFGVMESAMRASSFDM